MLLSVIIFFAIIYVIMNSRNKQSGTETHSDYDYPDMRGVGGRHTLIQDTGTPQTGRTPDRTAPMGSPQKGTASGVSSGGKVSNCADRFTAASKATGKATGQAIDTARQDEKKTTSTMAYLDEKAKQDQKEHAIEKMQERKRTSEKYGNRPVGGRYLLGDPIPKGMKIVYCPYCGAENLVKTDYRNDRDCYFCRTHL